ncbi:nitrite reductase small subunit NirD [Cryobacterium adonitolivorans]|uniref:Nitrite reductase small subunit NirD n=1 Tax=Cryobacterium adonitolivorans TaxID=1259189 RepID=A0A4R8WC86_9MICO|nr:nitrite reductase small subunit NirD [Cryobacterium adonitolivorans]TFC06477.1 nitrite reductase small subunit NirD [Cryobacterium adonitolivorans]
MLTAQDTTNTRSADATTGWATVCELSQLEPLWAEAAMVDGEQLALVRMPNGTVYAVSNQDPATGSFVMCRGIVGSHGDTVTLASPLHKQVYDLATGECLTSADLTLPTFETRVESGSVRVRLAPEASARAAA